MFLKVSSDVCVSPALCHFSESILEYLANLDKAPDPTVRKDTFSSEICASFDILFNSWLQSRESKVRAASICISELTVSYNQTTMRPFSFNKERRESIRAK